MPEVTVTPEQMEEITLRTGRLLLLLEGSGMPPDDLTLMALNNVMNYIARALNKEDEKKKKILIADASGAVRGRVLVEREEGEEEK